MKLSILLIMGILNVWSAYAQNCATPAEISAFLHKKVSSKEYNKTKVPGEAPIPIQVDMWVQGISSVSQENQNFEIDLYTSAYWTDPGLAYESLNPCRSSTAMDSEFHEEAWNPMVTFVNSQDLSVQKSPRLNVFTLVYPNGTIWLNARLHVTGQCEIDFSRFPLSSQICNLLYESYMYGNQDITLDWKGDIILIKDVALQGTTLKAIKSKVTNEEYPAGSWRRLTAVFEFENNGGFQLFRYYAPSCLAVILFWMTFLLRERFVVRTLLCTLSFAIIIGSGFAANIPRTNFLTAMDIWLIGSTVFGLCSIIEMMIVSSYEQYSYDGKKRQKVHFYKHTRIIDDVSDEEKKDLYEEHWQKCISLISY